MRGWLFSLAIVGLATSLLTAAANVEGLADKNEETRLQTSARLLEQKAAAVPALVGALDGDNPTARKMAGQTLFKLVQVVAGTPDQDAVAAALAAELDRNKTATQQQVCEVLGYLPATKPAVDALTNALNDKQIREAARMALVRAPGETATAALVGALAKADDEFKVAILNGLGEKGDLSATAALIEQTRAENRATGEAAWTALARLGSPGAVDAFTVAVQEQKDAFVTGLLLDYAHSLLKGGKLLEADAILKVRRAAGPLSTLEQCQLLHAHSQLGTPESVSLIMRGLDETDARIRGAAYEAAEVLPGTEVTRLLTTKMLSAKDQTKLDLLELLGKRGRQMDDRTVMMMYMAMLDKDDQVKIACIRAMQAAGVTSTLPTMINLARGPAGPVADAAEQALSQIPSPTVTTQVIQSLAGSTPAGRARLLNVLAVRGDEAAVSAMMDAARDPDAKVREAAYRGLGRLKVEDAYETLLAAFDGPAGPDRDAAEQALAELKGDVITARLLSDYFDSSDRQKPSLLRVLAGRQLEAIDALLMSESTSPDEQIREAAVQGLSKRAKPATAGALLAAARTGPASITSTALTGYLNIARSLERSDKPTAGTMFVEALKLAASDELKKAALQGIGRSADPQAGAVLDQVEPLMKNAKVADEAAGAVAGLASRLPEAQKARAVELLQRVVQESKNDAARQLAIARLRELGVEIDPARAEGFVTAWWLLGPIDRQQEQDAETMVARLDPVDLSKPVEVGGKQLTWKKLHTPDPRGVINLGAIFGELWAKEALAYAEITVDKAHEAVFKVGSDDGMVLWLNGRKVHAVGEDRPLVVDHDTVKVSLVAGTNRILVRVLQSGGGWGLCLRVVDGAGKPIALNQRVE